MDLCECIRKLKEFLKEREDFNIQHFKYVNSLKTFKKCVFLAEAELQRGKKGIIKLMALVNKL